jgi:two-component system response regulator AtoC
MSDAKFKVAIGSERRLYEKIRKLIPPRSEMLIEYSDLLSTLLKKNRAVPPQVLICEVDNPHRHPDDVLFALLQQNAGMSAIAITMRPDWRSAVHYLKMGAAEYFILPKEYQRVAEVVQERFNEWLAKQRADELLQFQQRRYNFDNIVGTSLKLGEVLYRAQAAIDMKDVTVLIVGETGTGKELLARAIHYNGVNRDKPFVEIACTAIPDTLLESELFGYERGAFTDARDTKQGLIEIANGGTLFLDEIGDISVSIQAKLLKVIEEKRFRRLGGVHDIQVTLRIIAATNKDMETAVAKGEFRKDLYYRLKVLPLHLPPLCERGDDAILLANTFIQQFNKLHQRNIVGLSPEVKELLRSYHWPGNVRELRHSIERAVMLAKSDTLHAHDFDFLQGEAEPPMIPSLDTHAQESDDVLTLRIPLNNISFTEVERQFVQRVLEHVQWNKSKAAKLMDISRPKLDRLIRKYSL